MAVCFRVFRIPRWVSVSLDFGYSKDTGEYQIGMETVLFWRKKVLVQMPSKFATPAAMFQRPTVGGGGFTKVITL